MKNQNEKMQVEVRVNPGDLVLGGFSYPNNATVKGDFLYLRDANGNIIPGKQVDIGDRITVLRVLADKKLALVQYPVNNNKDVREGYVTNATNIIVYDNLEKWVNGSTNEPVFESEAIDAKQIGYLNPREKATVLFKKGTRYNVVYNTSAGVRTKSGFVDYHGNAGSNSGTNSNDPWPNITPGGIVSGGFTFPNNAKLVGGSLQLKDANGNNVSGTVSNGDSITVLDVGYTKQLALVQYPTSGGVKQGYIDNNTNIIKYNDEYNWYNGTTPEDVYSKYNSSDSSFGTLSARESATKLYEYGGRVHIVYDTSKGMLTKSGYVNYKGRTVPPRQKLDLGSIGHKNARLKVYGKSGKGLNLNSYKLGAIDEPGKKIKKIFVGFALHGWEDHWRFDGEALVKIGSSVLTKLGNYISANGGLNGWQVCIAPCMNPDGLVYGRSSYGPGRCSVTTKIDMNRCFPVNFPASSAPRYYTGSTPLGAPEAVALKNLVTELANESSELMVVDCHGWLGFTQGNYDVGKYFTKQFGFSHKTQYSGGFFSTWANSLSNTKGVLLEYPTTTDDFSIVENYATKTFNAIIEIIKSSNGNGGSGSGNEGGSGSGNGDIVVGSKVRITGTHWATGQLIPEWVKNTTHTVGKIDGDRALLQEVTSWIYLKDIVLVDGGGSDSGNGGESGSENGKIVVGSKVKITGIHWATGQLIPEWAKNTTHTVSKIDGDRALLQEVTSWIYLKDIVLAEGGGTGLGNEEVFNRTGKIINVSTELNVRSGPGTTYSAIGKLYGGNKVTIVARVKPSVETLYWYKINFGAGTGYIRSDFVELDLSSESNNIDKIQIGAIEIDKVKKIDGKVYACIKQMLKGFCNSGGYSLSPDGSVVIVKIYSFHLKRSITKTFLESDCKLVNGDRYYELDKFIEILGYKDYVKEIYDIDNKKYKYVYIGYDDDTMLNIHEALDILGFVPVVGEVFDVANAIMYACEKEYLKAALSVGAIIPVVGSLFFKGGEYGFKIMKSFKFDPLKAIKFKKTTKLTESKYVYRAIHAVDLERIKSGKGLIAKMPNGPWSLEEHIIKGSSSASWKYDKYISTSLDLEISKVFNETNKLGIIKIDLDKVPKELINKSYNAFPLYDETGKRSLAYQYSVWQQEISIMNEIPREAFEIIE